MSIIFYFFRLALRSMRRNIALTSLTVVAIGIGIGASMTTLAVFRAMASDPIPERSEALFAVQIENVSAGSESVAADIRTLPLQLTYADARGLTDAHMAPRQAAMYVTGAVLKPRNPLLPAIQVQIRATDRDFFAMFLVPFRYGGPWTASDDASRCQCVVISQELNGRVFGGGNSVGKTIDLDGVEYQVVGVLGNWRPLPKFYDLNINKFGESEAVFLPFNRAVDYRLASWGNVSCPGEAETFDRLLRSECTWIQYWVELPDRASQSRYRTFLSGYSSEQRRIGRFGRAPVIQLTNVREWLTNRSVVSSEVRILVLISWNFLLVCLLNAMGLILAKFMSRSTDIGVRRALGASRRAIFTQCLIETVVIGASGGILGLAITGLGLASLRFVVSEGLARVIHLDFVILTGTLLLAVIGTMLVGLYPTIRSTRIEPSWQLKAQ